MAYCMPFGRRPKRTAGSAGMSLLLRPHALVGVPTIDGVGGCVMMAGAGWGWASATDMNAKTDAKAEKTA
ncbi:MAG TPA: hypothetical protein VM760_02540 [Sphingomicrobium sp.]|nr:hypothetical protein [Sphingomicrobium sp.]